MSKKLDSKPRILIAEGPWGIRENQLHDGFLGAGVFGYDVVTHKCKWRKNMLCKTNTIPLYIMKAETSFCTQCQELVPSMIQTLWTLKNMDKIQQDANYGNNWGASSFMFYPGGFYLHQTSKGGGKP